MKKLYADAPDVPQGVANRGVRIIERHLRLHKVERAKDLPEEAKVRLLRDLREFFDTEARSKGGQGPGAEGRGLWARLWEKLENFLSFSSLEGGPAVMVCPGYGSSVCVVLGDNR
jgi:hypothetical protein